MATNRSRKRPADSSPDNLAQTMRDQAQKIWLAGLGAFERAKADGPKMFETLVAQGQGLRARATEAADQALKTVRDQAGEAQGRWDKLEQVFEDRVSRSLNRLGVVTNREVQDLSRQVEELNETVREMMGAAAGGKARAPKRGGAKKASKAKKKASRAKRARPA
jgi:poly(hydroxyalkanoate) granule-associated protein